MLTIRRDSKAALYAAVVLGLRGLAPAESRAETETTDVAAPAERASPGIQEVIVTARRVEERLQDVPISMTVFNQAQLTERNVLSGRDLAMYTPSLAERRRPRQFSGQ